MEKKFKKGMYALLISSVLVSSTQVNAATSPPAQPGPAPETAVPDEPVKDGANDDSGSSGATVVNSVDQGAVENAAKTGAESALENAPDEIADKLSGGTGLTYADLYKGINGVDDALKAVETYANAKCITNEQIKNTMIGMYLSQFCPAMEGNLLNIVKGLEEDLSDEEKKTEIIINNQSSKVKLSDALSYIRSTYSVAPLYKGTDAKNIEGTATLRSLYEKDSYSLYIKDDVLKVDNLEVVNQASQETLNEKLSGDELYLPLLSKKARENKDFRITNLKVSTEQKAYCVFNSSSACRLALQVAYSEMERVHEIKKDEAAWKKTNELLDQQLFMDNFGNIVALDSTNKAYTIVINCMLNPTICEVGASEKFNMSAYSFMAPYTTYPGSGDDKLGLNYTKVSGGDAFEYSVSLNKSARKDIMKRDNGPARKYMSSKWISNLLDKETAEENPKISTPNKCVVFSFLTDDEIEKDKYRSINNSGDDKDEYVLKPQVPSLDWKEPKVKGTSNFTISEKTSGGEYSPGAGYIVGVVRGSEGGSPNLRKDGAELKGRSVVYIRTNHNRSQEAYYGYKGWFGKTGENISDVIQVDNSASSTALRGISGLPIGVSIGFTKASRAERGNLGYYTVMPVMTKTLWYGIGDKVVSKDSNKLNFNTTTVGGTSQAKTIKNDQIGYVPDYCGFYQKSRSSSTVYYGLLYTPKYSTRGQHSFVPDTREVLNPITELDASTILQVLQFHCKMGILRKANLFPWGNDGSKDAKDISGIKGYQAETTKLLKNLYKDGKGLYKYIPEDAKDEFKFDKDSPSTKVKAKNIVYIGLPVYSNSDLTKNTTATVVVYPNCLKGTTTEKYNKLEKLCSIMHNTSEDTTSITEVGQLSSKSKQAMKEEKAVDILDRVYELLTHPISSFIKMFSGFLQWIHTGLAEGTLESFFYITDENVESWMSNLPFILLIASILVLISSLVISTFKYIFNKDNTFGALVLKFFKCGALVVMPTILLMSMRNLVTSITDNGMSDSLIKIEAVYLNKSIEKAAEVEKNVAESKTQNTEYFREVFTKKRSAKVSIDIVDTETTVSKSSKTKVNAGRTNNYLYDTYNVYNISTDLSDMAAANVELATTESGEAKNKNNKALVYSGKRFDTVFQDAYDASVFFYFLDYYMNQWILLNGKYDVYVSSDANWGSKMISDMAGVKDTFRNYYKKRSVLYGPNSGSKTSKVLDDIFGLGMMFYVPYDDKGTKSTPESRGYWYPIEVFDSTMVEKKGTATNNSSTYSDLWNGYKHSALFMDDKFDTKTYKVTNRKSRNKQGSCKHLMGYDKKVLEARASKVNKAVSTAELKTQVIASEAFFEAENIPKKYATTLEKALWSVNSQIYADVQDYFKQNIGEVSDFTDVVMLAGISTFRFNQKFGKSASFNEDVELRAGKAYALSITSQIKPVSFNKNDLDMDVIIKAIYAGNKEASEEYDIMYYLGSDAWGLIAGLILVVAEIFMAVYIVIRMLHVVIVFVLSTVVCWVTYAVKKDTRNKAWLGILAQVVILGVAHAIMIWMMNMAVCNDLERGGFTFVLLSLLLLLGSVIGIALEIMVMLFLIKNVKDMGGQVVADMVKAASAKLKGAFNGLFKGRMKSNKVEVHGDSVDSYGNDDDAEVRNRKSAGDPDLAEAQEQADKVRGAKKKEKYMNGEGGDDNSSETTLELASNNLLNSSTSMEFNSTSQSFEENVSISTESVSKVDYSSIDFGFGGSDEGNVTVNNVNNEVHNNSFSNRSVSQSVVDFDQNTENNFMTADTNILNRGNSND